MIKFDKVSFCFPQKDLYNNISFAIEDGEHVVLIGSNGTGKSTLLNLILNTECYSYEGEIEKDQNMRIGYMSQFTKHENEEMTVFDFLAAPFVTLLGTSNDICNEMECSEDLEGLYEKYKIIVDQIDAVDGYNYETNIKKLLSTVKLTNIERQAIGKISGGEYKLLCIMRNMLLKPQLLIMDEPDVFLDFDNLVSLTKLINSYQGTILVVTHSRLLLSQCFDKILHIENQELQCFPGNFEEYNKLLLETKIEMVAHTLKFDEFIDEQKQLIDKLRDAATYLTDPSKGKQLKARESYLARIVEMRGKNPFIEIPDYDFTFLEAESLKSNSKFGSEKDIVFSVENYSLKYDRVILSECSFEVRKGDKIAIVGANGTGKSSLLSFIYNMMLDDSVLRDEVALFKQIYDNCVDNSSGGEKNISQLKEINSKETSIILLDEPTSHLDTYAQVALEKAINEYKGTVLMVSHDFFTVTNCADRIFILEKGRIREMGGRNYRKLIYKNYFESDIFEREKERIQTEIKINNLLNVGKYQEAKKTFMERYY